MNPTKKKNLELIAVWALLLVAPLVGCQAIHPFAEKSKARFASAKNWANRGLEAFQCGRLNQAKGLLIQATKVDPTDFRMRANLARTLYRSGDRREAITQMRHAVTQSKGDPELRVELGQMYLESGQWESARREAELTLETNHQFGPGWYLMGQTERARQDHSQALASFQRAVSFGLENPDVQMAIFELYREMGQPHRALSTIEQLLSHYSSYEFPENAVLAKSEILVELNQLEPAIELLQVAVQKENASSMAYLQLANTLSRSGKSSQARLTLKEGKRLFPDQPEFDAMIQQASWEQVDETKQAALAR